MLYHETVSYHKVKWLWVVRKTMQKNLLYLNYCRSHHIMKFPGSRLLIRVKCHHQIIT